VKQKAKSRRFDPRTSRAAARSVRDDTVTRLEGMIHKAIAKRGKKGATWDEVHRLTKIDKASISPRFKPMRDKGLIFAKEDDGGPIKRPGNSGRGQIVWFA